MTHYEFGDVVLARVPFTSQRGTKQRPAVVVSGAAYARARPDVILMAVTGRIRSPPGFGEIVIEDWDEAGLLKRSVLKPVLFTIEQRLIARILGRLSAGDRAVPQEGPSEPGRVGSG